MCRKVRCDRKVEILKKKVFYGMERVHAFDDIFCCSNGIISKIQAEACDGGNSDTGIDKGNVRNAFAT
jgi:hypothetical protein